MNERDIQNRMFVVGKDVAAEEGLRVVITDDGKHWDINKAKRGDTSQGGSGTIVEVRQHGNAGQVVLH